CVQYIVNYVEEQKKTASLYQSEKLESYDKYAFFFGGNSPIIRISTTASTGKNLLVLKDSYANCFLPFLIPYYDEIVVIDPRYYYDDIYSEITSQNITEILFLYNANTFLEDNSISGIFTQYE
uniref:DHHW family protein n=1 Tax=Frisingicoccus sp. TaxID=1918627 RepID=UPI0037362845